MGRVALLDLDLDPDLDLDLDLDQACEGAHALAVLTEWDEFKSLNFEVSVA